MALTRRWRDGWDAFWFRPAPARDLIVARALVCANSLWIVLSRPDLPDVLAWPSPFRSAVTPGMAARFLVFDLPLGVEVALYRVVLPCLLLCAALGVVSRLACGASALLLYHFASLEQLIVGGGLLWFQGLTHSILSLFILSFAVAPTREVRSSPEYRWPVAAIQALFCAIYFLAGVAKLAQAGLGWLAADNVRALVLAQMTRDVMITPWAAWVAASPGLCWAVGVLTVGGEVLFPAVLFSRWVAAVLVPVAVAAHVAIVATLGLVFPNFPMLLLFAPWPAPAVKTATPPE
jgi:hypothetical protein